MVIIIFYGDTVWLLFRRFRCEIKLIEALIGRLEARIKLFIGNHNGSFEFNLMKAVAVCNWSICCWKRRLKSNRRRRSSRSRCRCRCRCYCWWRWLDAWRKLTLLVIHIKANTWRQVCAQPLISCARPSVLSQQTSNTERWRQPGERNVVLVQVVSMGCSRAAIDWTRVVARQKVANCGPSCWIVSLNDETSEITLG